MAAAIGDRAAFPVHTMYTTGRSRISLTSLLPCGTGRPYGLPEPTDSAEIAAAGAAPGSSC